MARTRSIKPAFFANEELAELSAGTRLLFIGLWTLADRNGKVEDRPKRIKAELFPYDSVDIEEGLSKLHKAGFISRYTANGINVILVTNFKKHQNPHNKEQASDLPDEPEQIPEKAIEVEKNTPKPAENCKAEERLVQVPEFPVQALPITGTLLPITGNLNPITGTPLMDSHLPINDAKFNEKKTESEENPVWFHLTETSRFRLRKDDYNSWLALWHKGGGGNEEKFMQWLMDRWRWYEEQPVKVQKGWFIATQKYLLRMIDEKESIENYQS